MDPAAGIYIALPVFALACQTYTVLLAGVLWATKPASIFNLEFSNKKYYTLMGWGPLGFLALGVALDPRYLGFFLVAAAAGVIGELIVSVAWRSFFAIPIWTYSYGSILRGYTSTINAIPWAVGGLIFLETGRILFPSEGDAAPLARPVLVSAAAVTVGWIVAWVLRHWTSARERRFSKLALGVFCLPIVSAAVALAVCCDLYYPLRMLWFALVGTATEYIYGRTMSFCFERGLWTYNHWKIDHGHSSFVTFPLWALGGLYFHFIGRCLGL